MKAFPKTTDLASWADLKAGVIYQRGDPSDGFIDLEMYPVDGRWASPASVSIEVPTRRRRSFGPQIATVNWSARGSQPADVAEAYARLILEGVALARELQREFDDAQKGRP